MCVATIGWSGWISWADSGQCAIQHHSGQGPVRVLTWLRLGVGDGAEVEFATQAGVFGFLEGALAGLGNCHRGIGGIASTVMCGLSGARPSDTYPTRDELKRPLILLLRRSEAGCCWWAILGLNQ